MSFFSRNTDTVPTRQEFVYTHHNTPESSLVDAVYYNVSAQELAVVLHGEVYVYDGVDSDTYHDFVDAYSVGRAYQSIKRDFGPGEHMGSDLSVDFKAATPPVNVSRPAPVGTPKGLTYADGATITSTNSLKAEPLLDESEDKRVRLTPYGAEVIERKFDLATGTAPTRNHTVEFSVEGLDDTRLYNTEAGSVDEAVKNLTDATDALGINVSVKTVMVYFD